MGLASSPCISARSRVPQQSLLPLGQLSQTPGLYEVCHGAVLNLGDGLHLLIALNVEGETHTELACSHQGVAPYVAVCTCMPRTGFIR